MPVPASVPPVPMAQVKPSTLPSVCCQISGRWSQYGLDDWQYCQTDWPRPPVFGCFGKLLRQSTGIFDVIIVVLIGHGRHFDKLGSGKAQHILFSWLCVSGMTMTDLQPSALATRAMPMPVLPAVPSTIVPPGRNFRASASRIIYSAARSLTDWPGFAIRLCRECRAGFRRCFFEFDQGYCRWLLSCHCESAWVLGPAFMAKKYLLKIIYKLYDVYTVVLCEYERS